MPVDASEHGPALDRLSANVHWLMLVLFVGWGLYFLFVLKRFSAKQEPEGELPRRSEPLLDLHRSRLAVVEVILLVGFSIPMWSAWTQTPPPASNPLEIRVVAEQFAWNVHYPGPDGIFGKRDVKLVTSSNPLGIDLDDPNAKDDIITLNQLHLEVNRPVIIHVTSKDVIHSFKLPVMRVETDAIPGMEVAIHFTPIMTNESGTEHDKWEIACAQLCGLGHYRMRGQIFVHTKEIREVACRRAAGADESARSNETFPRSGARGAAPLETPVWLRRSPSSSPPGRCSSSSPERWSPRPAPAWPFPTGRSLRHGDAADGGGIFYEHGHRMIAAHGRLADVIQAIWLQLREPKRLGASSAGAPRCGHRAGPPRRRNRPAAPSALGLDRARRTRRDLLLPERVHRVLHLDAVPLPRAAIEKGDAPIGLTIALVVVAYRANPHRRADAPPRRRPGHPRFSAVVRAPRAAVHEPRNRRQLRAPRRRALRRDARDRPRRPSAALESRIRYGSSPISS